MVTKAIREDAGCPERLGWVRERGENRKSEPHAMSKEGNSTTPA